MPPQPAASTLERTLRPQPSQARWSLRLPRLNAISAPRRALLCAGFYLLCFAPVASSLLSVHGFPLDDSWIHQVVARNLALHHHLGFDPRHTSSGSTSILWTLLLALGQLTLPAHPVLYSLVLSALLLAGIGYHLARLVQEDGLPATPALLLALGPALSGNVQWFGLIGMEHLLFLLLSLVALRAWFHPGGLRLCAAACLLLVLTRPEGLLFPLILAVTHRPARRKLLDLLLPLAGTLFATFVSLALNLLTAGSPIPQTLQGRSLLKYILSPVLYRLLFLYQLLLRVLNLWLFPALDPRRNPHHTLAFAALALLLLVVLAVGLRTLLSLHAPRTRALYLWAACLFLLYLVVLPAVGHGGRYQSLFVLLLLPTLFLGIAHLLRPHLSARAFAPVLATLCCVAGLVSLLQWRRVSVACITQINSEHVATADWLLQHVPGARTAPLTAAFDIGAIGYALNGNLVDLGGLVDRSYIPALRQRQTVPWIRARGVQIVILPTLAGDGPSPFRDLLALDPAHGIDLLPLTTICADPLTAELAFDATSTATPCQEVSRARYLPATGASAPAASGPAR